jgi:hypothetical protein
VDDTSEKKTVEGEERKSEVEKENRKTMSNRNLIRLVFFSWRRVLKLGRKKLERNNT